MAFNLEAMLTVPLSLVLSVQCLTAVKPQCDSMHDINEAIAGGIIAREASSHLYRVDYKENWPVLIADPQTVIVETSLIYDMKQSFASEETGDRP